ncbi:DMT family transporter [Gammaproteobacteria bacterium]|nr:DMT family transporter [Gammaproteobacteria bacterium]
MSIDQTALSTHRTGLLLVAVSAVTFSTAGIFTNGVDTHAWDIIFWRGLAASGFTLCYLVFRRKLRIEALAFGRSALLATGLLAAGTAAFIPAFKLSGVANVALIYATCPFVAAALSWLFLREAPTKPVLIASAAAFFGVLLVFYDSLGGVRLAGDLLALTMTVMLAGTMVVYRARPETPAALPAALSSVVLLPIALLVSKPLLVDATEIPPLLAFGLVFALASVTLSEGARRLPSAETALLSTLEVPLAPLLAWLILSETITWPVGIGGAIVLLAVLGSQISVAWGRVADPAVGENV